MEDNSSICEFTGYGIYKLTLQKILFRKSGLENYLSKKTIDLLDFHDEIILYDLTKTYLECRVIDRVMNTIKCDITTLQYTKEQRIGIHKCSKPKEKVRRIYDVLNLSEKIW